MENYSGPLRLSKVIANIDIGTSAAADVTYHLYNPTAQALTPDLRVVRPGRAQLTVAGGTVTRPAPGTPVRPARAQLKPTVPPAAELLVSELSVLPVQGQHSRTTVFTPSIEIGDEALNQRIAQYSATVLLPAGAKRLVHSSLPPVVVDSVGGRIRCRFEQANARPAPLVLRWTDIDADLTISKTATERPGNQLEVSIKVRNNSRHEVRGITILDDYSESGVALVAGQTGTKMVNPHDRATRIVHEATFDLAAGAERVFTYRVALMGAGSRVPPTQATVQGEIVAIAYLPKFQKRPPLMPVSRTAFALPAGWSFDYLNDGDHHLNEHGMWVTGQNYNNAAQTLSWTTGCIFADKNFDDDYRWSATHQVLRFAPGYSYSTMSPWYAKSGNVSSVPGEFQNEDLKRYPSAVVLLTGWRLDFTSDDHHINKMSIWIRDVQFDRAAGRVRWTLDATYADKNFDDSYRFQYAYTVLGFDGRVVYRDFEGTDAGGSALHGADITDPALAGYANALVVPVGWSFDYLSDDHHINENAFKVQNIQFDRASGRVRWNTHLSYGDKNFDDDYKWRYRVAILGTSSGDMREHFAGPFTDDGGLAATTCNVSLNALFVPITWTNGVKDGTETGVDCGGNSPARDLTPIRAEIDPGNAGSAGLYSLRDEDERNVVRMYARQALLEYADALNVDPDAFYADTAPERPDRYVEAVAWYVDRHMEYVSDGTFGGAQSAYETLTDTAHRGPGDFNGDCEDHAILRAALLRALKFGRDCVFCADHHNSVDQGQAAECYGDKKGGGHTFNLVVYKGKYRIMDYGPIQARYWANKQAWNQHVVDNIWNDHTGKHWSQQDTSPFGSQPMVNYPGNPCSPGPNWDWRTYFNDVTL